MANIESRLALLCCACLTLVTFVAADAITIGADDPTPTSTSTCQDNPDFRHKKKESKSCEWVASHPQKTQLCSKKRFIRKHCLVACDSCNALKATCPKRETSRKFKADSCAEFEAGLDCGIRHVWTGCHSDTMVCTPTVTYSCNENSNDASKEWFKDDSMIAKIANNEMLCTPQDEDEAQQQETKSYHYGVGCDPKECPPFAPLLGSSCEWYKGYKGSIRKNSNILLDCYYDYQVTGCTDLDLECSPMLFASCDTLSQTWQHDMYDTMFCPLESQSQISESEEQAAQLLVVPTEPTPPLHIGQSCDPLTFSHCPYEQPTSKMGEGKPFQKKIKVFILLGQSNMLGLGTVKGAHKDGTLKHAVKTKNLYQYLVDDNGDWKKVVDPLVRNFFTMGSGNRSGNVKTNELLTVQNSRIIGPEIGIGYVVGQWLTSETCRSLEIGENDGDKESDEIFLLKSCIGNRSLGWDLLPPGSSSFEYTDERSGKKWEYAGYKESPSRWEAGTDPVPDDSWYAGEQYDGDIRRAKEVLADLPTYIPGTTSTTPYEVAGFFYWQGDKDRYDNAYAMRYKQNLIQLIRQLRVDFSSPNAKFVLATLGQTSQDSEDSKQSADRLIFNAQMEVSKLSEFVGNVACVYSKPFCHGGASDSHYNHNAETYMDVGLEMGRVMVSLFDDNVINSP